MGACASRSKVLKGEAIDPPAPEPQNEELVTATEAPEVSTVKEETKENSEAVKEEATSPPEAVEKEGSKAEPEEKPAADVTPPAAEAEEEKKAEVVAEQK